MESKRGMIKENVEFLILMITLISGFIWNQAEMKDFHGRLCILEERHVTMLQEQSEMRTLMYQAILEKK